MNFGDDSKGTLSGRSTHSSVSSESLDQYSRKGTPSAYSTTSNSKNDFLLFKLCLHIEKCPAFPKSAFYRVTFWHLDPFDLEENSGKCLLFPMAFKPRDDNEKLSLLFQVVDDSKILGFGLADLTEECHSLMKSEQYPDDVCGEKCTEITNNNDVIAEAILTFKLTCMGQQIISDANESNCIPSASSVEEQKYDEYCAEVNGYGLKIKVLSQKKKPSSIGNSNSKSKVASSESRGQQVERKGSKLIFQMPSQSEICTKGSGNALRNYIQTCTNDDEHGHENNRIKVQKGESGSSVAGKQDFYSIKIGKGEKNGRGKFEVEMLAPKPIPPELLKCKTQDVEVQTLPQVVEKKAKPKKKTK